MEQNKKNSGAIGVNKDIYPLILAYTPKVLIVDDDAIQQELIRAILQKIGYVCDTAVSGKECLEKAIKFEPDLILMDVLMPEMDGYETCSLLKSNPLTENIPVIMITSLNDRESKLKGLEAGASDFLNKPIDFIEFEIKTKNMLKLKGYQNNLKSSIALLESEILQRKKAEAEHAEAESHIKVLSGLLPICAGCKKIRNDAGYWEQIEVFIRNNSEANFSHGLCRECAEKLYGKDMTDRAYKDSDAKEFARRNKRKL